MPARICTHRRDVYAHIDAIMPALKGIVVPTLFTNCLYTLCIPTLNALIPNDWHGFHYEHPVLAF